jgi:hypothetical protein
MEMSWRKRRKSLIMKMEMSSRIKMEILTMEKRGAGDHGRKSLIMK